MPNLIAILYRRKVLILAVFVAFFAATTTYTLRAPKQYEARMKFFVNHERAESVVSPDSSNAIVRGEVSESDVNSEIELLTNGEILRQVVLRHGLQQVELKNLNEIGPEASGIATERAMRKLTKNLSISPVRKASLIQVVYTSENASQCATVLTSLAELYLEHHLKIHRTAGAQEFFRAQAQQYEKQLLASQERLAQFRRSKDVVLLAEQKDLGLRRLMDNEQALNEANTGYQEAAGRVATLRNQLRALDPRVVTQSRVIPNQYSVERLHTMIAELQNKRTELLVKFRSDDRLVKEVDDQIRDTTSALERAGKITSVEQTTDVNPLRQTLETELARAELSMAGLEARRAALITVLQASRSRLGQLDGSTAESEGLAREMRQAEENFVLYSKKQEEARIADSLDRQKIANVSVAEAPSRPYLPSKPNVPLNLALGFLFSLFLSLGVAFALEMNRSTFDSAEDLQSFADLPVLATVPLQHA